MGFLQCSERHLAELFAETIYRVGLTIWGAHTNARWGPSSPLFFPAVSDVNFQQMLQREVF